jgi:uncharacterized protein (TIGR03905 family)
MEKINYTPNGVCSRRMEIEVDDGKIIAVKIIGGCAGNTQGVSRLLVGMSIDEAIEFFGQEKATNKTCQRIVERLMPLQSVGLGYIKLGQSSSTLSGGESQRVKLASFLTKDTGKGSIIFIFDFSFS